MASSSWMILPLPRTGPSRRCRLQLTTKIRLSSCSRGERDGAERLRLVDLAVADEAPHAALAGVVDLAVLEVAVEAGVVERADRPEAHADRRVLPEVGHQARVRVARQAAAAAADLLAEVVEVVGGQAALHERPGVDAGRGVALEVHGVAGVAVVLAAEEVVEADLVEAGRAGERREVAADAVGVLVGLDDHHRRVPADERPDAPLDVLVAGEPRLVLAGDRVDVGRRDGRREADLGLLGPLEELGQQVPGPGLAVDVDDGVEGVEPLLGLVGIDVGDLMDVAVEDHGDQSRTVDRRPRRGCAGGRCGPCLVRSRSSSTPTAPAPGTRDQAVGRGRWRRTGPAGVGW